MFRKSSQFFRKPTNSTMMRRFAHIEGRQEFVDRIAYMLDKKKQQEIVGTLPADLALEIQAEIARTKKQASSFAPVIKMP